MTGPCSADRGRTRPRIAVAATPQRRAAAATATLEDLFTGEHTVGQPRRGATAEGQAQAPDRRLDRARRRPAPARRCRSRRPLGVEHLRGTHPRADGVGGAEGLRGGPGQRRSARDHRLRRHGRTDLADAVQRRRHEDPRGLLRLPDRHRSEPPIRARPVQAAEADDIRRGAGGAAGPRQQAGEHRAAARGAHGGAVASAPGRRHRAAAGRLPGGRRRPRPTTASPPTASKAGSSRRRTRSTPASPRRT